jgi:hypothetical protein
LAGLSGYTIRVVHSFSARKFYEDTTDQVTADTYYSGVGERMSGQLLDPNGDAVRKYNPIPPGSKDVHSFTVTDLLQAAGISLDEPLLPGISSENRRRSGTVLILSISYTNLGEWFRTGEKRWTMKVTPIAGAEFKTIETRYVDGSKNITKLNRHGIKILMQQTGTIYRFAMQALLIQAVSALGLTAFATLFVDSMMLYVLQWKDQYKRYKFDITPDFGDLRQKSKNLNRQGSSGPETVDDLNSQLASLRVPLTSDADGSYGGTSDS